MAFPSLLQMTTMTQKCLESGNILDMSLKVAVNNLFMPLELDAIFIFTLQV